jgi:hypothetical protein
MTAIAVAARRHQLQRRNIYAYQYQNLNSDGTPMAPGDLTAAGTTGSGSDNEGISAGCRLLFCHSSFMIATV